MKEMMRQREEHIDERNVTIVLYKAGVTRGEKYHV
jgi:hypothetical protein